MRVLTESNSDPTPPSWLEIELPPAWPDSLRMSRPADVWRLARKAVARQIDPVTLPPGLPLNVDLPKYLLQEFHNLPNGNYSRSLTDGYAAGFDVSMLGSLRAARAELAQALRDCRSALDIGCGAGHATRALRDAGIPEVWGLDASPYLLQHAGRRHPDLRFVQGLAEADRLLLASFRGGLRLLPVPRAPARRGRRGLARDPTPARAGGPNAPILEPGIERWKLSRLTLLRRYGWRGVYFWALARIANEPFLGSWHRRDVPRWLADHGFELISQRVTFPTHLYVARAK